MSDGLSSPPGDTESSSFADLAGLPQEFFDTVNRTGTDVQPHVLWINVATQRMLHFARTDADRLPNKGYALARIPYRISTSRYGIGQEENTNKTPLGLHRIADKIGAQALPGTAFKGRRPVGYTWEDLPEARITDRILWLDGLEPGMNRGGNVDSYRRYIYIHGTGDETTLGRPDTCGCTHVAAHELIPLFDILPVDTLVWISEH